MSDNKDFLSEKERRRLRVKRMKKMLIMTLVISILIPIITCIILCVKVAHLESDMRDLIEAKNSSTSVAEGGTDSESPNAIQSQPDSENYTKEDETLAQEETSVENVTETEPQVMKKVYLTFDDGPSVNTQNIIDILARYNVKATFFVVGKPDDASIALYKQIVDSGNSIGMHSYSHRYSTLYESTDAFAQDLAQIRQLITDATGVEPVLYRFPGGSSNTVSGEPMTEFIKYLNEQNITYFDWNVSSQDATSNAVSVDEIYNNVMAGVDNNDVSVVLMHDTEYKNTTVEVLPKIIEGLQSQGAEILPLSADVSPIQHVKASEVNE